MEWDDKIKLYRLLIEFRDEKKKECKQFVQDALNCDDDERMELKMFFYSERSKEKKQIQQAINLIVNTLEDETGKEIDELLGIHKK